MLVITAQREVPAQPTAHHYYGPEKFLISQNSLHLTRTRSNLVRRYLKMKPRINIQKVFPLNYTKCGPKKIKFCINTSALHLFV